MLPFSFSSVCNSYKGLSKGAALGCLLLWEATLWRSGTSSRVIRADELAHWVSVQMLHRQAFKHLFVSTAAPHNVWAISGPAVPTSLQLQDGRVVVPKTRIAPESHCSSVSLRAADVLRGSVDEMHVVIKTSTHITEEISHHMWVREHCSQVANLPILLGTANHGGEIWLVTVQSWQA